MKKKTGRHVSHHSCQQDCNDGLSNERREKMEKLHISDEHLLKAYKDAIRLQLTQDFLHLLESELKNRGIVSADRFATQLIH